MKALFYLALISLFASACSPPADFETLQTDAFAFIEAGQFDEVYAFADSVLQASDSFSATLLTSKDSIVVADLHLIKVSYLYDSGDTTAAVFAYIESLPWIQAIQPDYQVSEWRRYAETVGDAILQSQSPNMARLAWDGFKQAENLAIQLGDSLLAEKVWASKLDLNRRLFAMPDSIRLAFAPSTNDQQNSASPLAGLMVALAFGFLFGGGSFGVYKWRKTKQAVPQAPQLEDTTEDMLKAMWSFSMQPETVPVSIHQVVKTMCRTPNNQRAMFMATGLMTLTDNPEEADALKLANAVRSRLLRYFKKQGWEMGPGVLLPRDGDEWREWFNRPGSKAALPPTVQYYIKR